MKRAILLKGGGGYIGHGVTRTYSDPAHGTVGRTIAASAARERLRRRSLRAVDHDSVMAGTLYLNARCPTTAAIVDSTQAVPVSLLSGPAGPRRVEAVA